MSYSDSKNPHAADDGQLHVHVVSPAILLSVYGALVVFTVITVAVSRLDLGQANIWVALAIAVIKSSLVALFFMHLRWDSPFNSVALIAAFFFVSLFIGLAMLDSHSYQPILKPTPAAAVPQPQLVGVTYSSKLDFRPPRRAMAIGMWLFLASLSMLFFAGMLMYVLFSLRQFGNTSSVPVKLPRATWISTLVLMTGSFTIHRALSSVRRQRLGLMRNYLWATTGLAILFLIIQFFCLWIVLASHQAAVAVALSAEGGISAHPVPLDGLVFCLILLHALHVVGGVVAMTIVTFHASRGRYDHENYMGVRHAALYWHFLDIIWLMMFVIFMATA